MSAAPTTDSAEITLDWVIDNDTHISEPPDLFTSRLPAKWQEAAPKIIRSEKMGGAEVWAIGKEQTASIPVGHTAVAGWPEPFPAAPSGFAEIPKAAHDAHARIDYMDSLRIWAMAIYPNVGGFGSQAFLSLGEADLMLACVQAYNDFLTEWCFGRARAIHSDCGHALLGRGRVGERNRALRQGGS